MGSMQMTCCASVGKEHEGEEMSVAFMLCIFKAKSFRLVRL